MRQLVAFVEGDTLRYFVSEDGEQVRQVAEVINPGFDVRDVLQLGNVLSEALRLNGHRPPKRQPAVALPPAPPKPAASKRRRPPGSYSINIDIDDVIAAVRRQPGRTGAELGAELLPSYERVAANSAIGYRFNAYLDSCQRDGTEPAIRAEKGSYPTSPRHYFPT